MNKAVKKFEVPYNFDFSLIDFYKDHHDMIAFVYLPPFKADAINTRTLIENPVKGSLGYMPDTREEYAEHLKYLLDKDLRFCILWQDSKEIDEEVLRYYQQFGVYGYVVGNERNASIIHTFDPRLLLVASITMKLTFKDLLYRDFSLFNSIVLFFPFTRGLDSIKKLNHLKDKLVLMPNTICHTDCPAVHHWFPKDNELGPGDRCLAREKMDKCCFIYPEHLSLFDDHLSGYKLQGREYPTSEIMQNAVAYFERSSNSSFLEPAVDLQLRKLISEQGLEDYYNTKSDEMLSSLK